MRLKNLLIIFLFSFISCSESKKVAEPVVDPARNGIDYLALGDSYTIGESVAENERWPVQLTEELRVRGYDIVNPAIIAKTGWTTGDLLKAMEEKTGTKKYDLISILIGVNNQYQNRSLEEYEKDLNTIFQKAIKLSSRGADGIFVVSIPDYGVTPFGASNAEEIGKEIVEFNTILEKVAKEYNLPFYNITPISKRGKDEPDLVADDGLHPSGKMYHLWVEEFVDEVENLLPQEN